MTIWSLAFLLPFHTISYMNNSHSPEHPARKPKRNLVRIALPVLLLLAVIVLIMLALWRAEIPAEELEAVYAPSPPSRFMEIEGLRIHYRDQGPDGLQAPGAGSIVLLHGTFASLHTWEDWVRQLKGEYRLITLDLPGFGLTGPDPGGDYSMERTTWLIHSFLERVGALDDNPLHLGGNSLGGRIAWEFALEYPEIPASLILIDAAGYESQSPPPAIIRLATAPGIGNLLSRLTPKFLFRANLEGAYGDPGRFTDATLTRYYELNRREGNRRAILDRLGGGHRTDDGEGNPDSSYGGNRIAELASLEIPCLIMWGEKDSWIPVEQAHRFHADIPDSTLAIISGAGHVPMEEMPEESASILLEFLRQRF